MTDEVKKLGEPLAIEQLRGMDGQPVWCEWLLPEDRDVENGKWFIVIIGDKTGLEIKRPLDYGNYFLKTEDYGKTWLAYRYPPVKLDGWEPCVECKTCRNCKNYDDYDPYEGTTGECGQCYKMSNFDHVNFCQNCGRPLTDEARTMLEKRLRGCTE